jgi:hypothetical protein
MDLCDYCLKPAGHTHPPCGHCHGTGRCPVPFCIVCASPRYDDLPFPCGTCLHCAGEGIDFVAAIAELATAAGPEPNGEGRDAPLR